MAIRKTMTMPNGISLSYHRIVRAQINVNQNVNILILSYLDEEARIREKEMIDTPNPNDTYPYTESQYYTLEYNETIGVKSAYDYLKTLPEFEGAEDI